AYFDDTTSMGSGHPTYRIRHDGNLNAIADAGDVVVAFRFCDSGPNIYQLWYYPDASVSSYHILSEKVRYFRIYAPASPGVSMIAVTLRLDPSIDEDPVTNPEITVTTRAQYRNVTW
ncbi:MAG: hypothetical protein ABIH85_04475, partial [Candidatus Omnitrophota bacterium]